MTAQDRAELIMQSLPDVNLSSRRARELGTVIYTLEESGQTEMMSALDYYRVVCMVLSGGYKEEFRL